MAKKKTRKKTAKRTTAAKKSTKKKTTKKKTTKKKTTRKKTTKKATKKKAGRGRKVSGSAQREPLVVTSKVKAFIKSQNMMSGGEAIEALNAKVYSIVEEAIERAQSNKRSTIKPKDL